MAVREREVAAERGGPAEGLLIRPAVGGPAVVVEVFPGGGRAFLLEEGLGAGEVLGVGALAEADGPIGAVEEAVFGEGFEDALSRLAPSGFVPEI